jgi:hypothetical protein
VSTRARPGPSRLSRSLEHCITLCRNTVSAYLEPAEARENTFGQTLLSAIAAMQTAVAHDTDSTPERRKAALEIAAKLCYSAAEECRRHGFDEPLLRAADACERAATHCKNALR